MGSFTWAELRQGFADLMGDCTLGTATGGGVDYLEDTARRRESSGYWQDAYLKVYSGTGLGQERRLKDSDAAGVLRAESDWTTAPAAASLYELHTIMEASAYDRFLTYALRSLVRRRRLLLPKLDTTLAWVTDQYDYTVPVGFVGIKAVEVATVAAPGSDDYRFIGDDAWSIRQDTTRKLVFDNAIGNYNAGYQIRITGYAEFADPAADTDTYNLDPMPLWVTAMASACRSLSNQEPTSHWREDSVFYRDEAERLTAQMPSVPDTDVRWVEPN